MDMQEADTEEKAKRCNALRTAKTPGLIRTVCCNSVYLANQPSLTFCLLHCKLTFQSEFCLIEWSFQNVAT